MNLKPFDLQKALNGAKVVTRNGQQATQLVKFDVDENKEEYCLAAVVNGELITYRKNGSYQSYQSPNSLDLFLAPEVVTGWVLLHKGYNNQLVPGTGVYFTKEEAERLSNGVSIIAQITFEI